MIRIGLVSARPVLPALVEHARELLTAVADDVTTADTSRPGWSGAVVEGTARPGAAADLDLALTAELRGPATALAVDVAVTAGPLAADGVGLLVMDVDSTLITAEVIELLAEHAGTREQVAEVTERAMRGELDFAASLRERVATLAGLDTGVVDAVRDAVELSAGARELVAAVHERGGKVALVSGGFLEVVGPIAEELRIDHVVANRLEVQDGRLTGRTAGPVVDRAAKERHLRTWAAEDGVPLERVVAVGDGANDLDMLGAAGLGVAYCAKPVVQEQARAAVTFPRLDAVLGLLGG
ncbi:phosphoserine phosphatase [Georgenia satyanarayanai]|uniref:phosphoserine phosphatase n=1 Tax=Georgenia satyanarayanai TaxID=860221 RepID=A0A2Y9AQQ6_9MICO|nr:phosphoserine phosphatase SerB [Georgenia satyanarayanai]PYF98959.1 phosphoserine phosphatase [Georgenia satyanarayanai]SSA44807.1 phosphoserine phosphatase [Georgenia satyanarayanai]